MPRLMDIKKLPVQRRMAQISVRTEGEGDDKRTTYSVAVSSEAEVKRWYGIEVLSHAKDAVDMSRLNNGAAVLIDHYSDQVGVVEGARIDKDHVLRADLRFSKSARGQEIEADVRDGIRQNISVGYNIEQMTMTEMRDGVEVWTVDKWTPVEVSIVAVPADASVGVGRGSETEHPVQLHDGRAVEEADVKKKVRDTATGQVIEVDESDPRPAIQDGQRGAPEYDAGEVAAVLEANGMQGRIAEFIQKRTPLNDVLRAIIEHKRTKPDATATPGADPVVGTPKDMRKYSYARAILMAAKEEKEDGLEAEVSAELTRLAPQNAVLHGGIMVPVRRFPNGNPGATDAEKRSLVTNAITKGAEVVQEQYGELIDLLRNRTAVVDLGARVLTGLSAPVNFPKQSGAMSATWMGENPASGVPESDIALGLALLAPKTLQGATSYSRQLLVQASMDTEAFVVSELGTVHAIAIDRAAIHGLGAGGEPTGIYKAADVSTKTFSGAADYGKLLDMQGAVALLNAIMGALGYLMHPTMATNLRKQLDFTASAAGRPIWTGTYADGEVGGYRAIATNQVSNAMTGSESSGGSEIGVIFGNWNDIIIGSFGGMELVVDPYTGKKKGMIEVASFQMCDVLVRRGQSFCKGTGATG